MSTLAPICFFVYNRFEETKASILALEGNYLAKQSDLFIFSDGAKTESDYSSIIRIRKFVNNLHGFRSVRIFESVENKGLAKSIISGVNTIINEFGKVIVLEDDLITSANFLNFMNQALDKYENENCVFSISGYTMNLNTLVSYDKDYYIGVRASSWGWATWRDRWVSVDWDVESYPSFKYKIWANIRFMKGGSDLPKMLHNQMSGKIDSWAIRWCYQQFIDGKYTVFPTESMVLNNGFGEKSTHTKKGNRFICDLGDGDQREFNFCDIQLNKKILKEFRDKFSVYNRFIDRFLS